MGPSLIIAVAREGAAELRSGASAGATLNMSVQSDDNSGFTTATTRLTFTAATTRSGEYKSAAGPITDTYWRLSYSVSGTTPSVAFAVAIGIA